MFPYAFLFDDWRPRLVFLLDLSNIYIIPLLYPLPRLVSPYFTLRPLNRDEL